MASGIAQGASNVAGGVYQLAGDAYNAQQAVLQKQQQEQERLLREKEAEQKAAAKALKEAQDTHVIVSAREQYEVQANGLLDELKMKYPNNPEQIGPALRDGLKTFGQSVMDNPAITEDEILNLKVQDALTMSSSNVLKNAQNFQMERLPEAMRQTEEAARVNFVQALRQAKAEDRASIIEQFMGDEHTQKLFQYNYGPNAGNEMIEAIGKAYVAVGDDLAAQGDENGLKQLVNDPRFILAVPAEAAKAAAHDWETIAKQRVAAETERQKQAYQLNADSIELQIGNIDVNTDYTDQESMSNARKQYTDQYRVLADSDNPHKVKLMGELVNKITALDERSRTIHKQEVAEQKAEAREAKAEAKEVERERKQAEAQAREQRYNSPEAIAARGKIASMWASIAAKEKAGSASKSGTTYKNYPLNEQVKDHQNFIRALNEYQQAGYMDKNGTSNYQNYYDDIYTQGDKVNQRLRKKYGAASPATEPGFGANFATYATKFRNTHRNIVPPKGMNQSQARDALGTAYRETMYALRQAHVQKTGKEPDAGSLGVMDNIAQKAAYKALWH